MRQTRRAPRRRRVIRSTRATSGCVHVFPRLRRAAERSLAADRAAPAPVDAPGVAVVGERVELAPRGAANELDECRLAKPSHLAHLRQPVLVQLCAGDRSNTPQALDWERMQKRLFLARGNYEQPVRLRHRAGHLGQVLRGGDPHRDRQPHPLAHLPAQAHGDLLRGARDPLHPSYVEERLVDGDPFDQGRGVLEDLEYRLARLRVGGHSRRDDDRVGAEPPRQCTAHRALHAVGLGLVAGSEHDPAAHDHGAPAERRMVPLLDGGEERVEVGVEDVGLI